MILPESVVIQAVETTTNARLESTHGNVLTVVLGKRPAPPTVKVTLQASISKEHSASLSPKHSLQPGTIIYIYIYISVYIYTYTYINK